MWTPFLTALAGGLVILGEVLDHLTKKQKARVKAFCFWVPSRLQHRWLLTGIGGSVAIACALFDALEDTAYQTKIQTLSEETKDLVTGGKSFAFLMLTELPPGSGSFTGRVVHSGGPIPVYDVRVSLVSGLRCGELKPWTMRDAVAHGDDHIQYFAAVTWQSMSLLPNSFTPTCDDAEYGAIIEARNGTIFQQFRLLKESTGWKRATRVISLPAGTELFNCADKDFPRKADGTIDFGATDSTKDLMLMKSLERFLDPMNPARGECG